jgi:GNAT superfamily N-acetyltransferase
MGELRYRAEDLLRVEPPDREALWPFDLPGSDLPAMVTWAGQGPEMGRAFGVRREVFVLEQGYTEEQEFDEAEGLALHAIAQLVPGCATTLGAGRTLGTARLLVDGSEDPPVAYVSRLSVLPHARRMGVGRNLVEFLLEAARLLGCGRARAGAQVTALEFWEVLGFRPTGERYMDFHVPHEWTERDL